MRIKILKLKEIGYTEEEVLTGVVSLKEDHDFGFIIKYLGSGGIIKERKLSYEELEWGNYYDIVFIKAVLNRNKAFEQNEKLRRELL